MGTNSRRLPWLLGAVLAGAIAFAVLSRSPERAAPSNEPAAPEVSARPAPAAKPPPPPAAASPATPAPPSAASSAPGAPELPPTATSPAPSDDLPIPPELPQTTEWKLGKTELILDSLGKRVQRLEQEVREAEARGDHETAQRQRLLLERSRQRMVELQRDVAAMKADGGTP